MIYLMGLPSNGGTNGHDILVMHHSTELVKLMDLPGNALPDGLASVSFLMHYLMDFKLHYSTELLLVKLMMDLSAGPVLLA